MSSQVQKGFWHLVNVMGKRFWLKMEAQFQHTLGMRQQVNGTKLVMLLVQNLKMKKRVIRTKNQGKYITKENTMIIYLMLTLMTICQH